MKEIMLGLPFFNSSKRIEYYSRFVPTLPNSVHFKPSELRTGQDIPVIGPEVHFTQRCLLFPENGKLPIMATNTVNQEIDLKDIMDGDLDILSISDLEELLETMFESTDENLRNLDPEQNLSKFAKIVLNVTQQKVDLKVYRDSCCGSDSSGSEDECFGHDLNGVTGQVTKDSDITITPLRKRERECGNWDEGVNTKKKFCETYEAKNLGHSQERAAILIESFRAQGMGEYF